MLNEYGKTLVPPCHSLTAGFIKKSGLTFT
jgi:hypothetical protein